ncbi:hypothetical protein ACFV2N_25915 [Streptomyces sp. NPDC059680]|uniref:hypothetical protein n=1 Tax=Streptomyces sp. NPDC059680 TaxID=3346904 RepID=UPI0036B3B35F
MSEPEHLPEREQFDRLRADIGAQVLVQLVTNPEGRAFLFEILGVAPRPSVMDSTPEDVTELEQRCAHFLEFVKIYRRWRPRGDRRSLGELVRELPEDVREQVADHLVRAGLS